MSTLFWIAVGAFIGWNLPQPFWAKFVQDKLVSVVKNTVSKSE